MAGAEGTFYLIILFSLEFLRRKASPPQARSPHHAAQPFHKTPGLARPHAGDFGPGTHSFPWSIGAEQTLPFPRRGGRQHKVAPAPAGAARGDSQLLPSQPHTVSGGGKRCPPSILGAGCSCKSQLCALIALVSLSWRPGLGRPGMLEEGMGPGVRVAGNLGSDGIE